MVSYEEGAMNILRYEPEEQFGYCTPESFVARPVKSAVFTPHSFSVRLANGWCGLYVASVVTVEGKRTCSALTITVE